MPTKRLLPALLAALLLAAPAAAAEHAPGFEACIKKNPKRSDQKQCLDMERDYWQKKLDARYQAMQGICKKFSGPEAEKPAAPRPWTTSRRVCRISATAWNPCSIPA